MKPPKFSVTAMAFAILVIAINFAVIRAAFQSAGPVGWERGILPGMIGSQFLAPRIQSWPVFLYFLLPMIDQLLIIAYRLRFRREHNAKTAGYIIAGSAATLVVFTTCVLAPRAAIGIVTPLSRRIALASVHGLVPLFGNTWLQSRSMEWTYMFILAMLSPMAFFCTGPLFIAFVGGKVARRFRPSHPASGPT